MNKNVLFAKALRTKPLFWSLLTLSQIGMFITAHEASYLIYRRLYGRTGSSDLGWGIFIAYFLFVYIVTVIVVGLAGLFFAKGSGFVFALIEWLFLIPFGLNQLDDFPYKSVLLVIDASIGIFLPWTLCWLVIYLRRKLKPSKTL